MDTKRFVSLDRSAIPDRWFNVLPVLPTPLPPPRDPDGNGQSRIAMMNKIRVQTLLEQDRSMAEWIDVPPAVREEYIRAGRPTPLMRADALEQYLDTPARIYVKREDLLPTGSFKINTSLAQAYYASLEGAEGVVSETGAGQWGHALSFSCSRFALKCRVFWAKVSLEQKHHRASLAELMGAEILPSPSDRTEAGKKILMKTPDHPGSIGSAIGEAIDTARNMPSFRYVSGSNLPHVLLHQTIIGLETKKQLEAIGERPDVLIACVGGGSNLGGFMNPFLPDKLNRGDSLRLIGAESDAAPRLTKGEYRYDHSDPVGLTPKTLSYTLGMDYVPPPVHVGGLRQHNGSAIVGVLRHAGLLDAISYSQEEALMAGLVFLQCEGVLPAPETCHAIKAVLDIAQETKHARREQVIVMCFSGSGLLDMNAFTPLIATWRDRLTRNDTARPPAVQTVS